MEEYEYSLDFLPVALSDMSEIVSMFLMLESKNGAVRIKSKILKAAERIRSYPYSGVAVPDEKMAKNGFRMVVIEKYLMFYRVFEDEKNVVVYRILNGKPNYPALMNRLYNE